MHLSTPPYGHILSSPSNPKLLQLYIDLARGWQVRVRFLARESYSIFSGHAQTVSCAQPASDLKGVDGLFSGGKEAGTWNWPLTTILRGDEEWAVPYLYSPLRLNVLYKNNWTLIVALLLDAVWVTNSVYKQASNTATSYNLHISPVWASWWRRPARRCRRPDHTHWPTHLFAPPVTITRSGQCLWSVSALHGHLLPDNCHMSLPAVTPPRVWAVVCVGYVDTSTRWETVVTDSCQIK